MAGLSKKKREELIARWAGKSPEELAALADHINRMLSSDSNVDPTLAADILDVIQDIGEGATPPPQPAPQTAPPAEGIAALAPPAPDMPTVPRPPARNPSLSEGRVPAGRQVMDAVTGGIKSLFPNPEQDPFVKVGRPTFLPDNMNPAPSAPTPSPHGTSPVIARQPPPESGLFHGPDSFVKVGQKAERSLAGLPPMPDQRAAIDIHNAPGPHPPQEWREKDVAAPRQASQPYQPMVAGRPDIPTPSASQGLPALAGLNPENAQPDYVRVPRPAAPKGPRPQSPVVPKGGRIDHSNQGPFPWQWQGQPTALPTPNPHLQTRINQTPPPVKEGGVHDWLSWVPTKEQLWENFKNVPPASETLGGIFGGNEPSEAAKKQEQAMPANIPTPTPRPEPDTMLTQEQLSDPEGIDLSALDAQLSGIRGRGGGGAPQMGMPQYDEDKERKRTRALAQLALAGGIVSGAGPGWEGVGKGLLAAGAMHSEGFQRYQDALKSAADVEFKNQQTQYEHDKWSTTMGIGAAQAASKRRREEQQSRYDRLIAALGSEPDDELATPEEKEEWRRKHRSINELVYGEEIDLTI